MASREVKEAGIGNLGLQDRKRSFVLCTSFSSGLNTITTERFALGWVQKYINAFGGDPTKVTMYVYLEIKHITITTKGLYESISWGESAGAISVALQMLTNGGDTEGLFRGAFMESGSPIPTSDVTGGQVTYDTIVKEVGCASASDTLNCLRSVPFNVLASAVDLTPNIFSEEVRSNMQILFD